MHVNAFKWIICNLPLKAAFYCICTQRCLQLIQQHIQDILQRETISVLSVMSGVTGLIIAQTFIIT